MCNLINIFIHTHTYILYIQGEMNCGQIGEKEIGDEVITSTSRNLNQM